MNMLQNNNAWYGLWIGLFLWLLVFEYLRNVGEDSEGFILEVLQLLPTIALVFGTLQHFTAYSLSVKGFAAIGVGWLLWYVGSGLARFILVIFGQPLDRGTRQSG